MLLLKRAFMALLCVAMIVTYLVLSGVVGGSDLCEDQTVGTSWGNLESTGTKKFGERFNSFPACTIDRIDLKLRKYGTPTGTLTINVRTVTGDSVVGCLGTKNIADLTTTFTWYTFNADTVTVPSSQDIRIVAEWAGAGGGSVYVQASHTTTDQYYGGAMTYYAGSTWTDSSGTYSDDLVWRYLCLTFATPAPTPTPCASATPTPTPISGAGCGNFTGVESDSGASLAWDYVAGNGTITIIGKVGVCSGNITDGFPVYQGNATACSYYNPLMPESVCFTALVDGYTEPCTLTIGGEGVAAINSTLIIFVTLGLALGLSLLSLRLGAFSWFITAWAWVGLAVQVDNEWQGVAAGLMALFCMVLFILDALHGRGRR